jgi:hypothetical protein
VRASLSCGSCPVIEDPGVERSLFDLLDIIRMAASRLRGLSAASALPRPFDIVHRVLFSLVRIVDCTSPGFRLRTEAAWGPGSLFVVGTYHGLNMDEAQRPTAW